MEGFRVPKLSVPTKLSDLLGCSVIKDKLGEGQHIPPLAQEGKGRKNEINSRENCGEMAQGPGCWSTISNRAHKSKPHLTVYKAKLRDHNGFFCHPHL